MVYSLASYTPMLYTKGYRHCPKTTVKYATDTIHTHTYVHARAHTHTEYQLQNTTHSNKI